MKDIFEDYYNTNFWGSPESVSGSGSTLPATRQIRGMLSTFLPHLGITSLLDISCGDFKWFSKMWEKDLNYTIHDYVGGDIVPALIEENRAKYYHLLGVNFEVLDATRDELPKMDMIFCRDTLVHFSNHDINLAIKNFRASGSTWLLATTFPGANPNGDITTGQWRPVDLAALRYGLGPPNMTLLEGMTGQFKNKSLGLWRLNP